MNKDIFNREQAVRLFPFFPLNRRSELHNYLVKIPEYVEFNEDNREMPRFLFNDPTQKKLNTIITDWEVYLTFGLSQNLNALHLLEKNVKFLMSENNTVPFTPKIFLFLFSRSFVVCILNSISIFFNNSLKLFFLLMAFCF